MTTSVVPKEVRPLVPYWPKPNKQGQYNYGPKFTRYAMPWFETFYFKHKRYPLANEIMNRFGCTLEQVEQLNKHKFFLTCLESRGIALPGAEAFILTDRQVAAIAVLTNFSIVDSSASKVAMLGVTTEELNGWYQNPYFVSALQDRADSILGNVAPDAITALAKEIKKGNFPAIKFYFELTGRAQSPEAVNVKQAMQILIEAVQKHVKDPDTLQAIATEVQSLKTIQGL